MPSLECFRQFFNERLTAAAQEIFREFEKNIVEYEEEINRQRRLLDVALKPVVRLHKLEHPQQHACKEEEEVDEKEEVLSNWQLCNQERNSDSLDQGEPDPPQIKEEQEGLCTDTEELVLKQETDNIMLTFTYEEGDRSEDRTVCLNTVEDSEVPEPSTDHQGDHHTSDNGDSVSVRNKKPKRQRRRHSSTVPNDRVLSSTVPQISSNNEKGESSLKCDTCGKILKDKYKLLRHQRIHTGVKPFSCNDCKKTFRDAFDLRRHIKTHTGMKPYCCNMCGKRFTERSHLKGHTRIHTGEKPYSCKVCKKDFRFRCDFSAHIKTHPKAPLA
ncbi:zinc finger protein 665-like [Parambassis ranga]|uniref:Zinc finger protein 665-like n=1 Tax=Parambassis ranga TaxID=210632 RepID=A0A6P7J234_9TELE|nr:zinc finger protein 665-like [Parambassis ranga]